ncbi:MAG: sugar phosphate isomerase/epimerase family protein [Planctomycetaceae bacterium]
MSYQVHLPLHRRLAVSQLTTVRWSLPEALDGFRRCGVPAIGLSYSKLQARGLEAAIDEVQSAGLLVSSLGWIGGFTGSDGNSWEDAVREARLAIWTAGQVGAKSVSVVTGARGTHIRPHARRLVIQALKELAPLAAHCGVRLALQPMHRVHHARWTFLHSLDESLQILDRVNHPWLGLSYSPFHFADEDGLLERLPALVSRIAAVHLSDWHRPPQHDHDRVLPGDGCLPLPRHVELERAGYRGLYEVDPWCQELWRRPPTSLLAECRRRFESLCEPIIASELPLH